MQRLPSSEKRTRKDVAVYAGLLLVLLIIRLPSFFFSVFDWDESTFIVVGQSILEGNLPYVTAWDIKPPLAFSLYALFIALFGKSLAAVRLGGLLCIYIASLLVYETGKAANNRTAGIIAALFLMVFVSSGPSGLSTMTEHLLLVPVSWALYVMVSRRVTMRVAFLTGLLLGAGILTKTSMVFESLAVLALVAWGSTNPGAPLSARIRQCAVLILGMAMPLVVVLCAYGASDALDLLVRTNVNALFQYTGATGASFSEKFGVFLFNIEDNITLNPLVWITFVFGTVYLFVKERGNPVFLAVPLIIFAVQMVSLLLIAQPFGYHYLFTSMPVMAFVSGVFLSSWLSGQRTGRTLYHFVLLMVLGLGFFHSLQGSAVKYYGQLRANLVERRPPGDDTCSRIARFLESGGATGRYIYMVNSCQIVYWLTGSRYPTKYIHPSNLLIKEYLLKVMDGPEASREGELRSILAKQPLFIVHRTDLWPKELERFKRILDTELEARYELVQTIDIHYRIYARRSETGGQGR
jgi:4-amino-4-deoxy-L-arabinose transferase-like glycosyltransferase